MDLRVLCCFLAFAVCYCVAQGAEKKVPVTVYYESLCPDSKKFFTSQLYPPISAAGGNISKWVNLTLVPYGKSKMTPVNDDYQFECHHGPSECEGNLIHACALRHIETHQPAPKDSGFNPVTVGFINCLMDQVTKNESGYDFPIKKCAEINKVQQYLEIENCKAHSDGHKYLAQMGIMTENFQKPLQGVPTIVFNNQYKKEDNALAQTNFVKALCQYITGEKPAECAKGSAGIFAPASLLVLVAVSLLNSF